MSNSKDFKFALIGTLDLQKTADQVNKDIPKISKQLDKIDLGKTAKNAKQPTDELGKSIENVGNKTGKAAQEVRFF